MLLTKKFQSKENTGTEQDGVVKSEDKNKSNLGSDLGSIGAYGLAILVFVVGIGMLLFIALPSYNKIKTNKVKIQEEQAKLDKLIKQTEYLEKLYSLRDQLEQNMVMSEQALPKEARMPDLFNQLLAIADDSSVEVKNLNFSGDSLSPGATYGTVNAQMSVNGSYEQIYKFLQSLEGSRRIISANNLRVNINPESKNYELGLTLAGYYLPGVDNPQIPIEQLTQNGISDLVVKRISDLKYYDPGIYNSNVGKENPFESSGFNQINETNTAN